MSQDNVNFIADTYEGLLENLKSETKRLFGNDGYEDFSRDDVATLLMEWIAFSVSSLSWSSDRKISDNIMELTRSLRIAGFISKSAGLKLKGRTPQSVNITVTNKKTINITIPKYSTVVTTNGNFILTSDVIIGGGLSVTFTAIEANLLEFSGNLSGNAFQSFNLITAGIDDIQSIVPESAIVSIESDNQNESVDGFWVESDVLNYNVANDVNKNRYYTIDYINNTLEFGDGITGALPDKGLVKISFLVTKGDAVTQLKSGDVRAILSYTDNANINDITITNEIGYSGNSGDFDLEKIKHLYRGFKPSKSACITLEDFENHALRFQSQYGNVAVAKAIVWKNFKENSYIHSIKVSMFNLFEDFIKQLSIKLDLIKKEISSLLFDVSAFRVFIRYFKNTVSSMKNNIASMRTIYESTIDTSRSALSVCKSQAKIKPVDNLDTSSLVIENNFQYDFSNEKATMDDSISKIEKYLSIFDDPKDINDKSIDDFLSMFNNHYSVITSVSIDAIVSDYYRKVFSDLFEQLENQVNTLLYDPSTASVISLMIMAKNGNNFVPINIKLINDLYLYFNGIKDPTVVLSIVDGIGSVIRDKIEISIKVNEIKSGYSISTIKKRIEDIILELYSNMTFGQGILLYDISKAIDDNVRGVISTSAKINITDSTLEDIEIDEFGNLDISAVPNRIIQGIKVTVK